MELLLTVVQSLHDALDLLISFIEFPVNPQSENWFSEVIGSVNGLVCFYYKSSFMGPRNYVVYIWNPSLSAVITLPSFPPSSCLFGNHYRFGYDPKTDDYKVVKLTTSLTPCNVYEKVEVYSMRKGSWYRISGRFPSHIREVRDDDKVCVDGHDGHLHWLGSAGREWEPKTIVAFDVGAETFSEIPLPDSILHHHGGRFHVLKVWSGKLCVMSTAKNGECEVWVMNEYGVAESWVKHHVFGGYIVPYGFTSNNEFLFQDNDTKNFGLYEIVAAETKTFKMMNIQCDINKVVVRR